MPPTTCLDCGKTLANRSSKRCRACAFRHRTGHDNPNWKGGREPHCIDCGVEISGHGSRCQSCAQKARWATLRVIEYCKECHQPVRRKGAELCRSCFETRAVRSVCSDCGSRCDPRSEHQLCQRCYLRRFHENRSSQVASRTEKRCPGCKEVKPLTQFFKQRNRPDGHAIYCVSCHMARSNGGYHALRDAVMDAMGGACVRCGFSDYRALQIDHIAGNGADERRRLREQLGAFCRRLLRDGTDGYQLLCANCNTIKKVENGEHSWSQYSKRQRQVRERHAEYAVTV